MFTKPKLAKLTAFKALGKAALPATAILRVVDAGISFNDEYNRNPYLPEGWRNVRALSAVDLSVKKTSITVGSGLVAGAAIGAVFGGGQLA